MDSMNAPVMVELEGETDPLEVRIDFVLLHSFCLKPHMVVSIVSFSIC